MPRTRRAANGPTAQSQSTLSFKNRVTKQVDPAAPIKQKPTLNEPAKKIITEEIVRQATPEAEVEDKGKAAVKVESPVRIVPSPRRRRVQPVDREYENAVKEASKITDARIQKYWKAEEEKRMTSRGEIGR